jgi:hypothetical protein
MQSLHHFLLQKVAQQELVPRWLFLQVLALALALIALE